MRVGTCFLVLLILTTCQKKEEKTTPVFQVEVMPTVKDVDLYKTYVGNVQPFLQVEVKAQVEGEITGAYFKEGQTVQKGDLLFTIDPRPYVAQLQKAKGALAESMANLRYAEDVVKRNVSLAEKDYVSQLQYDQYLTNVLSYKGQIEQNEADIDTAKINLSYCKIHSPMEAVTGKIQIQVGNLIENAGSTPLITLNQITPIYTYFSVPQRDLPFIMQLHKEKPLKVRANLGKDNTFAFEGMLDLIDNQVNDQTGSIWLRGVFQNEDKLLWPGEFVDVRLYTESKQDAMLVPTEAVTLGQKGKYVFIIKPDLTAKLRYVQAGQRLDEMTLIESGIKPSDQVVVKGQINLANGTKVKIKTKEESQ